MYVPTHFNEENLDHLGQYMMASPFATLVTAVDAVPYASHLPLTFKQDSGDYGTLYGHVARANAHWQNFRNDRESLAVFTGPNAYVSPNWMGAGNAVPTWNYVAVHAYGTPCIVEEPHRVLDILATLSADHETVKTGMWTAAKMDQDVLLGMLKGIVAFEMPIHRIEGKRKMSQNKPDEAQRSAIQGLQDMDNPQSSAVALNMQTGKP